MLVAGYFRSGPAHSDNSTCSLKAWKAAEVPKSDRAYRDKVLHNYFCCVARNESWYPPGGIQAVIGALPVVWWCVYDDVSGMHGWFT